ncbi:unnamed protein product, partial [marine sediment metagenome]
MMTDQPEQNDRPEGDRPTGKRKWRRKMLLAIAVVAHTLGFLSSIDAVYNSRTPQGAIAWAAV